MYRQYEYYFKLNLLLSRYHLNYFPDGSIRMHQARVDRCRREMPLDDELIEACSKLVKKEMDKNLNLNLLLLTNFREEFTHALGDELRKAGVYYILFCLMIDKLLDDNGAMERDRINRYYAWHSLRIPLLRHVHTLPERSVLEKILNHMAESLRNAGDADSLPGLRLAESRMKDAIVSEFYIANISYYDLRPSIPERLIIDKSTRFVESSLYFAVADLELSADDRVVRVAESVAGVMALADDMMDLYEDIEASRTNLLLYRTGLDCNAEANLTRALDRILDTDLLQACVEELNRYMETIRMEGGKKLFACCRAILYGWVSELRNRIL